MSKGNGKLKWDTALYFLERPKSGTRTPTNAGESMEPEEFSHLVEGMQNQPTTPGDSLVVSDKSTHTLTI